MKKRKTLFWNALIATKEILGRKHPDAFTDMDHLASMLQDQCKYEEAVTLNRQVLKDTEEVKTSRHKSSHNLPSRQTPLSSSDGGIGYLTHSIQDSDTFGTSSTIILWD
jgi:hypothetical protein